MSMKILFVPKEFPHSKVIGGPIIIYNRIACLSQNHKVGLASFIQDEDRKYLDTITPYLNELELMPYPSPRAAPKKICDYLFSEVPLYMCNIKSARMREVVAEMTRRSNYDVVIAEYTMMGQYVYKNPGINPRTKRIVSCHECYTIARKKVREHYGIFSRKGLGALIDLKGLEKYEFAMYRDADKVLVLTSEEREGLLRYAPDLDIDIVPHGVDIGKFRPGRPQEQELSVAFLGNYPHDPNRDAVMHFINSIWPRIKRTLPGIKFYVIGRGPSRDILKAAEKDKAIIVTGEVDDVTEYLKKAKVFVSPIRLGKGFRGKLLEAMAMGIPVVTSSLGAEGVPVDDMNNILIADDIDTFIDKTIRLFKDDGLYRRVSENSKRLVEEKFSWQKGIEILEKTLEKLLENTN
ncbi:glycosyltransferase family 4 protein [candidate division NPL-UPA2 bacterium]|nr:glycosyltransferase family 4 protein [candidate division NPL-UPA2 bacterium]